MRGLFNLDNPVFRFMGKLFDIIVLNLVWLVCCLGIITIAPATTALYYAIAKSIRRDRSYPLREFFRSFKMNFAQGAWISVIGLAAAYLMYIDFQYAWASFQEGGNWGSILLGIFIVIAFMLIGTIFYSFAALSRFDLKLGKLLKFSFLASSRHMGYTFIIELLLAVAIFLCWFIIPGILFVPAIILWVISFIMEKILKKYTPIPEESEEEASKDRWYLE